MSRIVRKFGPNPLREKPWYKSKSYLGAAALAALGWGRPLAERYGFLLPGEMWSALMWSALGLMGVGLRSAQARAADASLYPYDDSAPGDTVPRYHPSAPGEQVDLRGALPLGGSSGPLGGRVVTGRPGGYVEAPQRPAYGRHGEIDPRQTVIIEGATYREDA